MARSTFYYHVKRLGAPDLHYDVRQRIAAIYAIHKGRYGYRRVTMQLQNDGVEINHKTVSKLMSKMHLYGKRKKGAKYKSYKGNVGKIAPNVLERNFRAEAPNRKWTTDVTEIRIRDRKIYLSPILDMFNGEIISYTISENPNLRMVTFMLKQAFKKIKDTKGLVFHSDQGWQYQHSQYQKMLKDKHIIQSMSRKGNCLDNEYSR